MLRERITGAAHPVVMGGGTWTTVMKRKMETMRPLDRSVARARAQLQVAESTVRGPKSFTEQEALAQHLIDYVPRTRTTFFDSWTAKFKRFNGRNDLSFSGSRSTPFG